MKNIKKVSKVFITFAVTFLLLTVFSACASFQPVKELVKVDLRGTKIAAGTAEAEFDKPFSLGKLEKKEILFFYYPADDVACLQFRANLNNYYQFWNRSGRETFINALTTYKADYETGNLGKSSFRTKRMYGTVRGYLAWETTKFSQVNYSYPNIEIGYYFNNERPYFALTQREAPNEDPNGKINDPGNSNLKIYFTRAQAEELAVLFDQHYLSSITSPASSVTETVPVPAETGQPLYEESSEW